MKRRSGKGEYDRWDKNLPVLLISGAEDPVGDGGKGVRAIYQRMQKAGMQQVTLELIPGARHDVLHENSQAQEIILNWLEK